jgi:TPP-dependent pyruvate/acetoin dehydrogenase alpha subunit
LVDAVKTSKEPGRETLLRMMEQLVLVREFETHCEEMWKAHAHMVGEYHLSLGQEAVAVGACAAVRQSDLIVADAKSVGSC